ncbi:LysR family transcriptional regulator [Chromobacterium alkanivorans]|uniref:LysR substrate-binding domain-containing protein n=1 Tax=Chromobacterium TaxID=535 RepID=UPI0006547773|nr:MULTISPECIES: LysR substrate-binding domain-containing protein [Chromobacterium]KMN83021.1 LysR family transcriptional regulator [Chromobacterium sp. LK11]MBN3002403.1 LysR family transcriptional regulator [Chromobacterium alkanivorans]
MLGWEGICEFVSVAEQGSFTKAAQALGISVAQVSRQVTQLEQRLGAKLLYRTTRHQALTEIGALYLRHCRQLLDSLAEAEQAISRHQAQPQGKLKLTAPLAYGQSHIAPLLTRFLQRHPQLEASLNLSNQVLDLVQDGYDLAIRIGHLSDSTLMARRLASRRHHVCAAPAYLERHGRPQEPADLERHNCLSLSGEHWHLQDGGRRRQVRVKGSLRCNSGHALAHAARLGLGLAQLPDYYVAGFLSSGELVEVLADYREPDEGIWALTPHNRQLSPKVRLLMDFLAESLIDDPLALPE